MLHDPQTAFGLIVLGLLCAAGSLRCSQSALRRPPSTAFLTSLDGTVCSAIVHARSRYRAFWSGLRQLVPAGLRLSRAGAAKARKKLSIRWNDQDGDAD
jgi:hypothetical protein